MSEGGWTRYIIVGVAILLIIPFVSAQPWCQIQQLFFQNQTSPEPSTYMVLSDSPSGLSEVDKSVSLSSSAGWVPIQTFISPIGYPGVSTIRKGLRTFNMYHYVSSASGLTVANYTVFLRHVDGTETTLYSVSSGDIDALATTKYSTLYVSPKDLNMVTTDRIGVKIYGMTSGLGPVTLHFVYEGTTHNSNIDTGYFECPGLNAKSGSVVPMNRVPTSQILPFLAVVLCVGIIFMRRYL